VHVDYHNGQHALEPLPCCHSRMACGKLSWHNITQRGAEGPTWILKTPYPTPRLAGSYTPCSVPDSSRGETMANLAAWLTWSGHPIGTEFGHGTSVGSIVFDLQSHGHDLPLDPLVHQCSSMFINSALIAIPPTFSNLRHLRLLAMVHSPIRACLRKGSAADFQHPTCCLCVIIWLVVLTILKNISQWEGLSHILWKIKNV